MMCIKCKGKNTIWQVLKEKWFCYDCSEQWDAVTIKDFIPGDKI